MNWRAFYSHWGNVFGLKGQGYSAQGHRGTDVTNVPRGTGVPAYRSGVITKVERSQYLGRVVCIDADADEYYDGYAHLQDRVNVSVGQHVNAGDIIGYIAGAQDSPGISWDGSHLHTTRGKSNESIYAGPVYDPKPIIIAAITASVAANGQTPLTIGDEDMAIQIIKEINPKPGQYKRYGVMGSKSGFTHIGSMDQVNALLVGIGKSELEAVRGVSPAEFDLIAQVLTA